METQSSTLDITKSFSDNRSYKFIKLSNELCALLISDMEADKSAASMDVKVGCSLDPVPLYGTAHFLEHMLFMGTSKYPEENEYSAFIQNNGGYNNAYTSTTDTNYHFDVSNEQFEQALDRFAQFFISPAFKEDSTAREMKAVDSEYKQSLQSDVWHFWHLVMQTSHPDSHFHRFSCGSEETLKQEGVREALLDFHKKYYSSNIMRLCIQGRHSIEQLESWVLEKFQAVENKNVALPDLGTPKPYDSSNLGQVLKFVPIKDKDIISFLWFLPYTQKDLETQPLKYHSHLFGHEGENSLLSYLISEGLALALTSYFDHDLWAFTSFGIDITLTKKGLTEVQRVVEAVFQYAQIVRDRKPQDFIFEELRLLGAINFKFADKKNSMNTCVGYSSRMQYYEESQIKDIIRQQYVSEEFDREKTQQISELLCDPNNLLIVMRSKQFEGKTDQTTPFYNTKYSKELISEEWKEKIHKPNCPINKKKLDLPPPNNLLPKNFDIFEKNEDYSKKPVLLEKWDNCELWFKKDDKFNRPKGVVTLKIYTNDCGMATNDADPRIFVDMWSAVVQEVLREFNYQAEMASLKSKLIIYHDNVHFEWAGYNDSLLTFVKETLERIRNMNMKDQEEVFEQQKEKLSREFHNHYYEQTFRQAATAFENILVSVSQQKKNLKASLEKLTFQRFIELNEQWLKSGRLLWYICGNIEKTTALSLVTEALNILHLSSEHRKDLRQVACLKLDRNYVVEQPVIDEENDNSCLVSYYQIGEEGMNLKLKMVNEVVMQFLDEPCFNQLRTIEQLGYVVFSQSVSQRDVIGNRFLVQSPTKSPEHCLSSLHSFLAKMREEVKNISEEDFKVQVEAVVTKVAEKDYNLEKENARLVQEISTHKYLFGRQDQEVETLRALTKQEFQEHFEKVFFSEGTKRLDLEFNAVAHKEDQEKCKNENLDKLFKEAQREKGENDIDDFKKNREFFPDFLKKNYVELKL